MNDEQTQTFDPETFMNQTVDAPLSTEALICPEGEYPATIDDFDASKLFRTIEWKDKSTGADRSSQMLSLPWIIQDQGVKDYMGRDKVVVPMDSFLDMKDGRLDDSKGKNVILGRTREALGQNTPGQWSFSMLRGAGPAVVRVKHIVDEKTGTTRAKVTNVTRMS